MAAMWGGNWHRECLNDDCPVIIYDDSQGIKCPHCDRVGEARKSIVEPK